MSRGTPTITIRLSPDIRKQLEAEASDKGETVSTIIREAILQHLEGGA